MERSHVEKRRKFFLPPRSLALLVCLTACQISAIAQERHAPKPILVPGDTWTYKVIPSIQKTEPHEELLVRTVSFASDAAILGTTLRIVGGTQAEEEDWTLTPELNTVTTAIRISGALSKVTLVPHRGTFRFPLRVGDQYESSYRLVTTKSDKSRLAIVTKRTSKVLGWETVTVPAGTFSTIVVEAVGTTGSAKATELSPVHEKHWYSPDVRHWVKSTVENKNTAFELQLVSFKLKDD